MASIAALLSALATMSKDGVLSALNVIAALVTEESLLRILGDYVNSQTGMKKSAVRFEIYSNHEKEYYLVLGIVHPSGEGAAKKKVSVEQINELMIDLAGSARNELITKLKCDEKAVTEDSLLYVLADHANSVLSIKKSIARATIYSDCEPQYRQILSILQPDVDAQSRKRALPDSDGGGDAKKARVGATTPPPTSLDAPADSALLLLQEKFGQSSLVKKVEARAADMQKQWLGLRFLWDRSERRPAWQQGLGLGATVWTEPKKTCDFVFCSS